MARKPGPPTVYRPKNSPYYRARFTIREIRHDEPTGCTDEQDALEAAVRLHAETQLGRKIVRPQRKIKTDPAELEGLVRDYLQWMRAQGRAKRYVKSHAGHLNAFMDRWQDLSDITPESIADWQIARRSDLAKTKTGKPIKGRNVSTVTQYKEEVTLRGFLKWARDVRKLLPELPHFRHVKATSEHVAKDLTREECLKLLAALPDRHTHSKKQPVREFYTVVWALGLRRAEGMQIRWGWIDFRPRPNMPFGTITLPAVYQKNRKTSSGALPQVAYEILLDLKGNTDPLPSAHVFGVRDFKRSLMKAGKAAGLGHITPHVLRHSRSSEIGASTRDIAGLQHFTRHTSLSMVQRYLHTRAESAAEAIAFADGYADILANNSGEVVRQNKNRPQAKLATSGRKKRS